MKIDIDKFRKEWEKQYKGLLHAKRTRIWIGDKEIIGVGNWKMTTIPWYLRWWYWLKMRRIYGGKI